MVLDKSHSWPLTQTTPFKPTPNPDHDLTQTTPFEATPSPTTIFLGPILT
jgi:hypothetical protein